MMRWKAPESWVYAAAGIGAVGIILVVAGRLAESRPVVRLGVWLTAPLLAVAVLLVVVAIPLTLWARRKAKRLPPPQDERS